MLNEVIPYWDNGDTLTCRVSAAVFGKRFVSISATRDLTLGGSATGAQPVVAQTGAGLGSCIGVAAYDQPTVGGSVTVFHEPSIVVPVTAGASITAGQLVKADAAGKAIPQGGTGVVLGCALDTVTSGQDCAIDRSIIA